MSRDNFITTDNLNVIINHLRSNFILDQRRQNQYQMTSVYPLLLLIPNFRTLEHVIKQILNVIEKIHSIISYNLYGKKRGDGFYYFFS